jgi:hypothetical protein
MLLVLTSSPRNILLQQTVQKGTAETMTPFSSSSVCPCPPGKLLEGRQGQEGEEYLRNTKARQINTNSTGCFPSTTGKNKFKMTLSWS